MRKIVLKKDLPLGNGRKLCKGLAIRVSDSEADSLIGARFAVDFDEHMKPKPMAKAKPAKVDADKG